MINTRVVSSVVFIVFVMLAGCGLSDVSNSNLGDGSDVPLTPTMHTAFQLTPASARMPDPVPVEGFGMYEVAGLGGSGQGQADAEVETAVPGLDEETNTPELVEGDLLKTSLVEGEFADSAETIVVNQVIVVTPLPHTASVTEPTTAIKGSGGNSQPLPTRTLPPPSVVNANSGNTAHVTYTPTPICGGNRFNEPGPANRVNRMPIDFEEFGTWKRSENTYGAFLLTSLMSKSGQHAAWMCYFFDTLEDETAVFTQIHPVPGQPNTVRAWVYGNRSGHFLGIWILDSDLETWLVPLGAVLHEGWEMMEGTFAGPNADPIFYISGPSNQRIDYPISFRGISINDSPNDAITYGSLVIDEISFVTE